MFGVKRWPKEEYGHFFKGDSYIVMNTFKATEDAEKLSFDVHFWIGAESSQDEYGVAAYKTVELDDLLGGDPVQHRETMGHESSMFLSYFPDGMITKAGGIASGFRHVETAEYKPSLLHVMRSKGHCSAFEVDLAITSMDSSDCFVLDSGAKIYVYHGEGADPFEKIKATEIAEAMESKRGDGCEASPNLDDAFWSLVGGTADQVSTGESAAFKPIEWTEPTLYALEDDKTWLEAHKGLLAATDIPSDDVMLIDVGQKLFVCIGSEAPADEKAECMIRAQAFLNDSDLPNFTPIMRIKEGQNPNDEAYTKAFTSEEGVPPEGEAAPTEPEPEAEKPKFPLAELVEGVPDGVDAAHKEQYLNDDEFEGALGCSREAFAALPKWKSAKKKKAAGIF